MATLKVSVTTMSTINDEIKSTRSVISSSTSSTVNISAETGSCDLQDINTILTATQTTTTTTVNGVGVDEETTSTSSSSSSSTSAQDDTSSKDTAAAASAPAPGKESSSSSSSVVRVSQESTHRFRSTRTKMYRVKNLSWYCQRCDVYCNSAPQFDVHMMSQKHKLIASGGLLSTSLTELNLVLPKLTSASPEGACEPTDDSAALVRRAENGNESDQDHDPSKKKLNPIIEFNLIATQCNIDANRYLIPASKKKGKFEKFGFYCSKCDAYMTGQIQLVMHVRGAKHQYFSPNEIPNYQPSKVYNPNQSHERRIKYVSQRTNFFKAIREGTNLTYLFNQSAASSSFYKNYFYNQIMANTSICNKTANLSRHCHQRTGAGGGGGGGRRLPALYAPASFQVDGSMNRDAYPIDMCFYDYFFRTQELIHNQNYHHHHHHRFSPFGNYSNGGGQQLFDENAAYARAAIHSPDMIRHLATGSIDSSVSDYGSDQLSWPSYSSIGSPNGSPAYLSHYLAQQQPAYYGGYTATPSEPYNLGQAVQNLQLDPSVDNQPKQANGSSSSEGPAQLVNQRQPDVQQQQQQSTSANPVQDKADNLALYRMVSKSYSGKLVQITPAPALNNGVSMLIMNSEAAASVSNNPGSSNFVVNGNRLPTGPAKNTIAPTATEQPISRGVYYQHHPVPFHHYNPVQSQQHHPVQYQSPPYMSQPVAFANNNANNKTLYHQDDSPARLIRTSAGPGAPSAFSSYFHHTVY